ncbi:MULTISPECIES: methyltransferase family protein [Paenarthrobacter]|jgi:protein-S-isoprenylcysteine O-methyltransferase Ste14|uniref:methyltransferase family protein n=1 Tax=Paenarthrobacter TaxID=1742992 RepID=UPI002230E0B9|nr:isoprenylcysteine carboxylmethyltransferase family protein [Paenarthrobacter sp. PAE-2]MCW3767244.1 isoprenylcysteine carboxylmethyltransferase family protein [Paenarthrobacter sp. PAE-2]
MSTDYGYDLWVLVIINSAVFIVFAFSFVRPRTKLDWRALGGFSAFIVALFTEMYGFPLTVYLLSGWLGDRLPGGNLLDHNSGHLWQDLTGWKGDPHLSPLHLLSNVLIAAGFIVLYLSWQVLFSAQRDHRLATTGLYARVRHPQYSGFLIIMAGFLMQWPTLLTLLMFPVLVIVYLRLARREERAMEAEFGDAYATYRRQVPGFVPRFGRREADSRRSLRQK